MGRIRVLIAPVSVHCLLVALIRLSIWPDWSESFSGRKNDIVGFHNVLNVICLANSK